LVNVTNPLQLPIDTVYDFLWTIKLNYAGRW